MKFSKTVFFIFLIFAIFMFCLANRFSSLVTGLQSGGFFEKYFYAINNFLTNFIEKPFYISTNKIDLIIGVVGFFIPVSIYLYANTGRTNFMVGKEHGSAEWGKHGNIKPFLDPNPEKNMLFTSKEGMSTDTRRTFRNNNVVIIGGSGSGKTRFYVKPNLMQCHSSYVITDPKGSLIHETGSMLEKNGYKVKIFNLVDFTKSDRYNFFEYIHDEKDILKLITNLITNTNGKDAKGGDFWEKAETALLEALFAFVNMEAPKEERNIATVMELLRLAEVKEENENFKSPLDILFEDLKSEKPDHFASKQYDLFKLAAGKTAKSILVSVGVRLATFNIKAVSDMLSEDTIELNKVGDEKTALFIVLSDSDKTFNFLAAMMYQQLFDSLFLRAEQKYGGRLPVHVRFLLDEFANIGLIPNFEIYIATMRSREMSVNVILQNVAQLKGLYKDTWETITGNCDTLLFLGGKEQSTLEYISKMIGKTTVDLRTQSHSKGGQGSYSDSGQVVGRELIMPDEVGLLAGEECILSVRGVKPFRSTKYVIEKHKRYKLLSDYNEDNKYIIKDADTRKIEKYEKEGKEVPKTAQQIREANFASLMAGEITEINLADFIDVEAFKLSIETQMLQNELDEIQNNQKVADSTNK
jgi:type IV secretion system protein VirD4